MATKLYVGINGSGKSYEVVTVVILDALRAGRRIVSNIAGLNYEAMCEIIIAEGQKPESIGTIVSVSHEQVLKDHFFRADSDPADFETFLQAGDLLVLDEIWRFWRKRNSVTDRQLNYFRMHRHFVHPVSGLTCENVLITQLINDVQADILGVIEQTFAMKKHTDLGTTDYYLVDIYHRTPTCRRDGIPRGTPVASYQRKYNPELFKLYKSHSVNTVDVQAVEQSIDKRGTIWKGAIFRLGIPLAIILICGGSWYIWRFFHPKPVTDTAHPATASAAVPAHPASNISSEWRIIGWYPSGLHHVIVLKGANGVIRYLMNPPDLTAQARNFTVTLPDGQIATSYSGASDDKRGLIK
jgi:zona occludens toxin